MVVASARRTARPLSLGRSRNAWTARMDRLSLQSKAGRTNLLITFHYRGQTN